MNGAAGSAPGMTGAERRRVGSFDAEPGSHSSLVHLGLAFCIAGIVAVLMALGVWQLERRAWKLDLIARADQRVHAPPVALPGPATWPNVTAEQDEYRHVSASGRYLNDRETYVQAVTDLGAGFWVLTPFRTDRGFTVLVNRGFVSPERRDPATRAAGRITGGTTVTGLLRITEPKGGFLRTNDPMHDRWYSRDVAAIAAARGLPGAAPYFIDAAAGPNPDAWPRAGLTVIAFPNNHLVYAITWFGLAFTLIGALIFARREEWRKWWTI
jgi:surfeit locus 1 family protein